MFRPFSNMLVVSAMLIAFVGQAMAYASMSCEMLADYHPSHQNMEHAQMDHAQMDHAFMDHASMDQSLMGHSLMDHSQMGENQSMSSEECCGTDCICPVNACTSVTLLPAGVNASAFTALSEAVSLPGVQQPKSVSTSLYRPPIFA